MFSNYYELIWCICVYCSAFIGLVFGIIYAFKVNKKEKNYLDSLDSYELSIVLKYKTNTKLTFDDFKRKKK